MFLVSLSISRLFALEYCIEAGSSVNVFRMILGSLLVHDMLLLILCVKINRIFLVRLQSLKFEIRRFTVHGTGLLEEDSVHHVLSNFKTQIIRMSACRWEPRVIHDSKEKTRVRHQAINPSNKIIIKKHKPTQKR